MRNDHGHSGWRVIVRMARLRPWQTNRRQGLINDGSWSKVKSGEETEGGRSSSVLLVFALFNHILQSDKTEIVCWPYVGVSRRICRCSAFGECGEAERLERLKRLNQNQRDKRDQERCAFT